MPAVLSKPIKPHDELSLPMNVWAIRRNASGKEIGFAYRFTQDEMIMIYPSGHSNVRPVRLVSKGETYQVMAFDEAIVITNDGSIVSIENK